MVTGTSTSLSVTHDPCPFVSGEASSLKIMETNLTTSTPSRVSSDANLATASFMAAITYPYLPAALSIFSNMLALVSGRV